MGFNIGFTVYFTIIEVKKIIRRFFISRFHCIKIFLALRLQGRSGG